MMDKKTQKNLEREYSKKLESLRAQLVSQIQPLEEAWKQQNNNDNKASLCLDDDFLIGVDIEVKLLTHYVVLMEGTPKGLAEFASRAPKEQQLLDTYLSEDENNKNKSYWKVLYEMLLADGASAPPQKGGPGPAAWGPALKILSEIEEESEHARQQQQEEGVLRRLALAIALEHAVPIVQENPKATCTAEDNNNKFVDPVRRYLNYEMAYLEGELDAAFEDLTVWDLRMVVNGNEPDETLAWGRTMLRNFRPNHIWNPDFAWRYVGLVRTDIRYGSQHVKYDRPELQLYQNILMNGGICGRRAFIGRFILRAFGIPTTARPSKGHGALCHWTPPDNKGGGWVVNLGPGWGCGYTKTRYHKDVDFLATTKARNHCDGYAKIKKLQWIGDVRGEKRVYGDHEDDKKNHDHLGFWYGKALELQRAIIEESQHSNKNIQSDPSHEHKITTLAEKIQATPVPSNAKTIQYQQEEGIIIIPAAAFDNPRRTKDVNVMRSFRGGWQIYLPSFSPQGQTILRGASWKGGPKQCCSGYRLLSGGYGKYEDWGFRVAVGSYDEDNDNTCREGTMTLDLGVNGVNMELVYIKPGTFVMGGESTTDGRFGCVEVPKHEVQLTKGYYLGKYPVTQAQYQAVMGSNPSKSTKSPDCPVDNVGENDALDFCQKLVDTIGRDVRLPTEAEWEYASRAGSGDTKCFFGDDPSQLGEYAWFKDNAGGKSHPVGQKKPNPWGLYDIYGNVHERVADKYAKNYYATSPAVDPTGPVQGTKSSFAFPVQIPQGGNYLLTAEVVTANYDQRLNVAVNDETSEIVIEMPFTLGQWQKTSPVTLLLKEGTNKLRFWRDKPPQYGLAIDSFTLKPSS